MNKYNLKQENISTGDKSHPSMSLVIPRKGAQNLNSRSLPHPDKPRQDASPSHIQGPRKFGPPFLREADAILGAVTSSKMLLLFGRPCNTLSCPPIELPNLSVSPWLQEGDDPTTCSASLGVSRPPYQVVN